MSDRLLPDYESIIDQLGIDDHEGLKSYIKPAMVACFDKNADEFPVGASRFGGDPDLAPGMEWPKSDVGPIPFVAQVNLSELPASPRRELLPQTGMLYFFYGNPDGELFFPDDGDPPNGGVAVLFAEDLSNLSRVEMPEEMDEEYGRMEEPQLLHFRPCNTFVDWEHPVWLRHGLRNGPDMPELPTPWSEDERPNFQILGIPTAMQASVCTYVTDEPLSGDAQKQEEQIDWALGLETLFQAIDCVGDCSLYYMIQREDLLGRRWDKFRWTLQCT